MVPANTKVILFAYRRYRHCRRSTALRSDRLFLRHASVGALGVSLDTDILQDLRRKDWDQWALPEGVSELGLSLLSLRG